MNKKMKRLALAALCLIATGVAVAADPTYSVKHLDQFARATGINNLGDIVGERHVGEGILLRNGQSTPDVLGSLGGFTFPKAVNDNRQVVGEALLGDGVTLRAFLYSGGAITALDLLPGHTESGATDINGKGQITGWTQSSSLRLPFVYSGGRTTLLEIDKNVVGVAEASATAINDRGHVVGNLLAKEGDNDPPYVWGIFRYAFGSLAPGGGTLGGHSRQALALNVNGLWVGWSEVKLESRTRHAAAWYDLRPTDLGTLAGHTDSVATSVNKNAQIVGYSYGTSEDSSRAFLYISGWMFDLNSRLASSASGWLIQKAIAINDNGLILAEGCDTTQSPHRCGLPLLLTPVTTTGTKPPRNR